mmetsp:Transcript_22038/g.34198  ORF Transcript_22038/g.34198 Transcript_22038/m.34198 type:complete len:123 (+) Transcript_22038:207-575(+)
MKGELTKLVNIIGFSKQTLNDGTHPKRVITKKKRETLDSDSADPMMALIDPDMNILNNEMLGGKSTGRQSAKSVSVTPKHSGNASRVISPPSIEHYKPQELIRIEVEYNQLKSELETNQVFF